MTINGSLWLSILAIGAACNPAYADRTVVNPGEPMAVQPPEVSAYQVDLIGEDGLPLATYQHRGKFYVLGTVGERYSLRVQNPTDQRVEAVLSIDGLDAIDGETADYVGKRGYVVPARGELVVDGFRVSTSHVATFRFSSVKSSYAGRKGKARNVGVIGVAIFTERAQPQLVLSERTPEPSRFREPDSSYDDWGEEESPPPPPKSRPAAKGSVGGQPGFGGASRSGARKETAERSVAQDRGPGCCGARPKERPGLGTEFGERRYSAASYTRFERSHATRPTAVAEFRYNDRQGLLALGIALPPLVDADEISTRETANPFPGSHFASPPR